MKTITLYQSVCFARVIILIYKSNDIYIYIYMYVYIENSVTTCHFVIFIGNNYFL